MLDLAATFTAYLFPLVLRFDGQVPGLYWRNFWTFIPLVAVFYLLANHIFGLYGRMWRYASVREARRILSATGLAGAISTVFGVLPIWGGRALPLSVLVFGALLAFVITGAIRFQARLFGIRRRLALEGRERILLVGAGDAGEMVLKDLLRRGDIELEPVGLLDDDRRKIGRTLHGIPVLGPIRDLSELVERHHVDQVLFTMPSADVQAVRSVAALCEEADVALRVLPSVRELVNGEVTVQDIRDLKIEDLLGREQVETDIEAVRGIIADRRVLITGAGGSIGSEISRQVAGLEPAELILLDHDETHLHEIAQDLEGAPVQTVLADVRDQDEIFAIFMRHRPEVVFHAAAHKHVPLLENHPKEAFTTNIIGTANLADAAVAAGVGRFVLISTDKAIHPTSVMGASKWFAEQVVRSLQGGGCLFSAVRFGNVLGSRGSVVPTFLRQVARGGPVTVTHPSMSRYFMSIREAVQLVLQAAALSRGGEVFTLDMGEPTVIVDLAREIIRLSGRVPGRDVEISMVGTRPGEKLVEEIVDIREEVLDSAHPKIAVSRPPVPNRAALRGGMRELEALGRDGRGEDLAARMKKLADASVREREPMRNA